VNGYATTGWENLFVAEAGAAAALAGLLFVAVSINLKQVLSFPELPGRAAEALMMLLGVLGASTLGLVPGQRRTTLGAELLILSLFIWMGPLVIQLRAQRTPHTTLFRTLVRAIGNQAATLSFVLAALTLLWGAGGGLYWTVPGILFSFAAGMFDAWVLLIEIQR
jgi:hypothetical protein